MIIPNKVYNVMKWILVIFIPALIGLCTMIFPLYHIPHLEIVVGTIAAIQTFLGACMGISTKAYNKRLNDTND